MDNFLTIYLYNLQYPMAGQQPQTITLGAPAFCTSLWILTLFKKPYAQVEHHADNLRFFIVYDQPVDFMLPFVEDAALFQPVPVWRCTAPEPSFQHHLAQCRFGADGGFLALTVRPPVADVVGKAVGVRPEALFTLVDAPHSDAMLHEPFHHEGGLIGFAAQTVKHKHQQDIKFALLGPLFDELHLVPVIGADLESGHAGLLFLANNDPSHFPGELPAGFALDGDVRLVQLIAVDLLCCGYPV